MRGREGIGRVRRSTWNLVPALRKGFPRTTAGASVSGVGGSIGVRQEG